MAVGNIPGIIFLLGATILLVLASISVPVVKRFYFLESHFNGVEFAGQSFGRTKLTVGMWGYCINPPGGFETTCSHAKLGYGLDLDFLNINDNGRLASALIRGLTKAQILHPIAAGITFVAFIFALSTNPVVDILASAIAFLGFIVCAIVFGIDCGLYITARNRINDVDDDSTELGNAFWMVMTAVILTFLASFLVCFGFLKRRRASRRGAPAPVMTERRRWPWQRY
ncbi:pali-domain-containing protein [Atractiella rhizophila]|nr:pali-domain-containing protein [Atractiella rhizophila]